MDRRDLKGKLVVFPDGAKIGQHDDVDIRWDDDHQAWYKFIFDEDGNPVKNDDWWLKDEPVYARMYATEIIDKPGYVPRKKKQFIPSRETCQIEIHPCGHSEKAYKVYAGNDGYGRSRTIYYIWIAKSMCYVDEDGRIFAPVWAVR